ncbi:FapA family protein [Alkalicoccobacillus porphyridii]|uniref:FapA family protein n=1 Tax=Alkalicoccobacillus porphyridii TaxID=2597270 RepID=A0A554A1L9_9BACI|nr:FapA family protein [Alkalicoccobacillus porphyridii]TSB47591.1 FapA family protein [Alkalicoccobacillus porphyridii]
MKQVVKKGSSVSEAITSGISHFNTTKEHVKIDVIQGSKKGFLGIGKQEAIVQITLLQSTDPIAELLTPKESLPAQPVKAKKEEFAGKAWITNGVLHHQDGIDSFPILHAPNNVEVYCGKELLEEKRIILDDSNSYTLNPIESHRRTKWKIDVNQTKLEAVLSIDPGFKTVRTLEDVKPDTRIEVLTNEKTTIINSLTYEEVMQELQNQKVVIGFNQAEIINAIKTKESGQFIVATGKQPGEGREGRVELLLNLDIKNGPQISEEGLANYREIKVIPNIEQGKIIALIHQPVQGKPGYTITNEPIDAIPYQEIVVKSGKGVVIIDDKIVAIDSGRPHIQKRGKLHRVSILPKLTHRNDVNIATGNIHFKGDVEIFGEVQQGMVVEAEGNIHIHKAVNNAEVLTSGSVNINGNIIHSEISAGRQNILISELGQRLTPIIDVFYALLTVIKQVTLAPGFKSSNFSRNGLHSLIFILLENRFKHLPVLIKQFIEEVKEAEPYLEDENWMGVLTSSTNLFLFISPAEQQVTIQGLEQLLATLRELKQLSETPVEPNSFIIFKHASNSSIYSSGNIIVTGTGCINTTLHSKGKIIGSGIFRGGELFAQGGVELNEVGSEVNAVTLISVPEDQMIDIKMVHGGTVLQIGDVRYTFDQASENVKASFNKQKHIIEFL